MSQRLYYFTNAFPYGEGEKSFVAPELSRLTESYDVTIVSLAAPDVVQCKETASQLPANVRLLTLPKALWLKVCLCALRLPFTKEGRSEIARIVAARRKVFSRLIIATLHYGAALELKNRLSHAGVFDEVSSAIYYTFWFNEALLACALEKKRYPSMTLISRIHRYELYEESNPYDWQFFQPFMARLTNHIFFLTQDARTYFTERYLSGDDKQIMARSSIIPMGCVGPDKESKWESPKCPVLVSCSNAIPLKRVDLIIEALALLRDLDIEWVHLGAGSELSALENLAKKRGIKAKFKGYVSNDQIHEFYATEEITAFITTSSSEGLPVSIQEAMAYGIPIIGTDVGGISEEIDGNGILLSASPTIDEIAEAIRQMIELPASFYGQMRKRSRELWEIKFNFEINYQKLIIEIERCSATEKNEARPQREQ